MKHLKYLNKYFIKYKWLFLSGCLFIIISNIFGVLPPIVIRHAFNLVHEQIIAYSSATGDAGRGQIFSDFNRSLLLFAVMVVGLALLRGLFMFFMRQTIIVMSRH